MLSKRSILCCAAGFTVALSLCTCSRNGRTAIAPAAPAPVANPAPSNVIECTGVLHPAKTFVVRLKPNETVEQLCVREGDQPAAGDRLAVLSCPPLREQWLATRTRLLDLRREAGQTDRLRWRKQVAETRLEEARKRIAATEALRQKVAGYDPAIQARDLMDERTRAEEQVEELTREIAESLELRQAEAPLLQALEQSAAQLDLQISNLVVRAPWKGVVVRAERAPGPGETLLELQDRSRFDVRGALWQNQLAGAQTGDTVTVLPDFMPGSCWTGVVTSIGLAAEPAPAQSFPRFPVIVLLNDGPETGLLRAGMTVLMRIHGRHGGERTASERQGN